MATITPTGGDAAAAAAAIAEFESMEAYVKIFVDALSALKLNNPQQFGQYAQILEDRQALLEAAVVITQNGETTLADWMPKLTLPPKEMFVIPQPPLAAAYFYYYNVLFRTALECQQWEDSILNSEKTPTGEVLAGTAAKINLLNVAVIAMLNYANDVCAFYHNLLKTQRLALVPLREIIVISRETRLDKVILQHLSTFAERLLPLINKLNDFVIILLGWFMPGRAMDVVTDMFEIGRLNELINENDFIKQPEKDFPIYNKVVRDLFTYATRVLAVYREIRRLSPKTVTEHNIIKLMRTIIKLNNDAMTMNVKVLGVTYYYYVQANMSSLIQNIQRFFIFTVELNLQQWLITLPLLQQPATTPPSATARLTPKPSTTLTPKEEETMITNLSPQQQQPSSPTGLSLGGTIIMGAGVLASLFGLHQLAKTVTQGVIGLPPQPTPPLPPSPIMPIIRPSIMSSYITRWAPSLNTPNITAAAVAAAGLVSYHYYRRRKNHQSHGNQASRQDTPHQPNHDKKPVNRRKRVKQQLQRRKSKLIKTLH